MGYGPNEKDIKKPPPFKSNYANFDECIDAAKRAGVNQTRTDAYAEGDGYLGVDDIDRMRRRKII